MFWGFYAVFADLMSETHLSFYCNLCEYVQLYLVFVGFEQCIEIPKYLKCKKN